MEVIAIILGIILGVAFYKNSHSKIICPYCKYEGIGKQTGGTCGCLVIILLCLGFIPGILYLLFTGKKGVCCPKCGVKIR